MCYICCNCSALIIGGVTLIVHLHLEILIKVEHILARYLAAVSTAHSVFFHGSALIHKRENLVYLHVSSEGRLSVA